MEYATVCRTLSAIEGTSKRLEKTRLIADLLGESGDETEFVLLLLQGRLFPAWQKDKIGVSSKIMLNVLAQVTGASKSTLEKEWTDVGDLGLVAEKHITGKSQQTLVSKSLSVEYVISQLRKLSTVEGTGSVGIKQKMISELLSQSSPVEARYITRTVLEVLRIGIAQGTLRDAIIYAYLSEQAGIVDGEIAQREKYKEITLLVQAAYDKTNDFTQVALAAKKGVEALKEIHITIGVPLKVMLGVKGATVTEAMETLGKPLVIQKKYDGFRVEIHKSGEDVQIFTRRLEDVTKQFPDIVESVRKHVSADICILDGEAIGIDTQSGKYKPFQEISQRIRRKYDIEEIIEKLPVDVRIFDIMLLDDRETLDLPFTERHALLEKIITKGELFNIAETLITSSEEEGEGYYQEALKENFEGIFVKKHDSIYQPGARVGNWIKIKDVMEPLDLVVVGAEWGEGKRSGWFTSFVLACQDADGTLLTIGKAATGLKELEEQGFSFQEITELLKPLVEFEEGRSVIVKPEVVLEVAYDEIQKSPSYESGYALRFPRILRNRSDERSVEDATYVDYVEQLYTSQG